MTHDPAASADPPEPEATRRSDARRSQPTLPTEVPVHEWAALGYTQELTRPGQMDTENANDGSADATEPPRDAAQKGVNTLGDYHLVKKLGEGAMGVVYRARQ